MCYQDGTTSHSTVSFIHGLRQVGVHPPYLHKGQELVPEIEAWKCPLLTPEKAENFILKSQTLKTYF